MPQTGGVLSASVRVLRMGRIVPTSGLSIRANVSGTSDNLDLAQDCLTERLEVFSGYPIFEMCSTARFVYRVTIDKGSPDLHARNEARSTCGNVPVVGDLHRIFVREDERASLTARSTSPGVPCSNAALYSGGNSSANLTNRSVISACSIPAAAEP